MTRLAASLALLGVARLLPEDGAGLYLRLGAATLALLWPFAGGGASATVAWSGLALVGALAVTFLVHGSLTLTLALYAAAAVATALLRGPRRLPRLALPARERLPLAPGGVLLAGAALGIALWPLSRAPAGDALFHLARVRKLDDLGSLSLHALDEFRDGGLHPGYAFPLWHGFLALVARLGGVDPAAVVQHEASLLAPVLFLVTYEAGLRLFRSGALAWAVLAAQVGLAGFAAGHGGALGSLALPATVSQLLLATAALALVLRAVDDPGPRAYGAVAAAALALAFVHPTYGVFLVIALAGFVAARALLSGRDVRPLALGAVAIALPTGAVSLWLLPTVRTTVRSVTGTATGVERYRGQLSECGHDCFAIVPQLADRRGAIAVAALALVPLAALARRSLWAALILGATVTLLALTLWPTTFVPLAHAASLSQARRLLAFLPLPFALAGGCAVAARLLGPLALPLALAAGTLLQRAYPGSFGYVFRGGGPAAATWIALIGGAAALAWGAVVRRPQRFERRGLVAGAAALLLVAPVLVHGARLWSTPPGSGIVLTPGLLHALRTEVPERAVVYSDPETSYRIAAYAPVYIAVAPPTHVANTSANRPYARAAAARRFLASGNLAIPRRAGASYVVLDRRRTRLTLPLRVLYRDARFTLYRL